MITLTTAAILAFAQQAGQAVSAIPNENPETWVLEYPGSIKPFVDDYYNCLKSRSHEIGGSMGFADQHRADIPKCVDQRADAYETSIAVLDRRGNPFDFTSPEVNAVFDTIQQIHIARGRDLDQQIARRLGQNPTQYGDNVVSKESANLAEEDVVEPDEVEASEASERSELAPSNVAAAEALQSVK